MKKNVNNKFELNEVFDKNIGRIVLYRTHNDDLLPAIVMEDHGEDVFDLMVFDNHFNHLNPDPKHPGLMYLTKIPKDTGKFILDKETWLPKYREMG